jgi:hypothetical protein
VRAGELSLSSPRSCRQSCNLRITAGSKGLRDSEVVPGVTEPGSPKGGSSRACRGAAPAARPPCSELGAGAGLAQLSYPAARSLEVCGACRIEVLHQNLVEELRSSRVLLMGAPGGARRAGCYLLLAPGSSAGLWKSDPPTPSHPLSHRPWKSLPPPSRPPRDSAQLRTASTAMKSRARGRDLGIPCSKDAGLSSAIQGRRTPFACDRPAPSCSVASYPAALASSTTSALGARFIAASTVAPIVSAALRTGSSARCA